MNGLLGVKCRWAGTIAALLYANKGLGFVMMSAMVLNLAVAAFAGMIPLTLKNWT